MHPGGDREGMWTLLPGENLDGRIEKFVLPEISYNQITSTLYKKCQKLILNLPIYGVPSKILPVPMLRGVSCWWQLDRLLGPEGDMFGIWLFPKPTDREIWQWEVDFIFKKLLIVFR